MILMNSSLAVDTIFGSHGLWYKMEILFSLVQGMWTSMTPLGLVLLFFTAILTGANITLLIEKITSLRKFDKLQLVVGGNSILGIVGSGCSACGLPIISFLGLGGSIMYLPFQGAEIPYISIIMLSISLYVMILNRKQICKINYAKN
jgi:hypothetical protein